MTSWLTKQWADWWIIETLIGCSPGMRLSFCLLSLCASNVHRRLVLRSSKGWQCNIKEGQRTFDSLLSPCSRPRAFICWLQFISSHYTAADLIACTFCCHLKGISCHAPNWCTCSQPRTVFVLLGHVTSVSSIRAQTILHTSTLTYIQTVDSGFLFGKVCFMSSFCRLNMIIARRALNPLILEHPEVTLCTMQLLYILCAIWKQACCLFSVVLHL